MSTTSLKISDNLWNLKDFIKDKIEFVYPVWNSIDMFYYYHTFEGYKIPCNINFNKIWCDLLMNFEYMNQQIKKDLVFCLEKYDCDFIN